jgi:hypothetical protein
MKHPQITPQEATKIGHAFEAHLRQSPSPDSRAIAMAIGAVIATGIPMPGRWRTVVLHDLGYQIQYEVPTRVATFVVLEQYETRAEWWLEATAIDRGRELERLTALAKERLMAALAI